MAQEVATQHQWELVDLHMSQDHRWHRQKYRERFVSLLFMHVAQVEGVEDEDLAYGGSDYDNNRRVVMFSVVIDPSVVNSRYKFVQGLFLPRTQGSLLEYAKAGSFNCVPVEEQFQDAHNSYILANVRDLAARIDPYLQDYRTLTSTSTRGTGLDWTFFNDFQVAFGLKDPPVEGNYPGHIAQLSSAESEGRRIQEVRAAQKSPPAMVEFIRKAHSEGLIAIRIPHDSVQCFKDILEEYVGIGFHDATHCKYIEWQFISSVITNDPSFFKSQLASL